MSTAVLVTVYSKKWGIVEELGISYIAAALEKNNYQTEVVYICEDGKQGIETFKKILKQKKPLLVGYGCSHKKFDISLYEYLSTIVSTCAPIAHQTCGGVWASFNADQLLQQWHQLDSVVIGEGESTILTLIQSLERKKDIASCKGIFQRTTKYLPCDIQADLDTLPLPLRNPHIIGQKGITSISTSRGCLGHCTFCNMPAWMQQFGNGSWRGRSVKAVVDEIENIVKNIKINRFWIVDSSYEDPVPWGYDRIRKIADEILHRELHIAYYAFFRAESFLKKESSDLFNHLINSGLRRVFLGIESGNEHELKKYAKRSGKKDITKALQVLNRMPLACRIGFIMFNPYSTFDSLLQNLSFLKQNNLLFSALDLTTCLEVYTGADIIRELKDDELLSDITFNNPYCYKFIEPGIGEMSRALIETRETTDYKWDILHTADVILAGAIHMPALKNDSSISKLIKKFQANLQEIKAFISGQNEEFFLKALNLASSGWNRTDFLSLKETYIDGYNKTIWETTEILITELIINLGRAGYKLIW